METTAIIFLALVCLWLILDLMRTSNRRKWYRIGYTKACLKYDKSDDERTVSIGVESDQEYHDEYEKKYD